MIFDIFNYSNFLLRTKIYLSNDRFDVSTLLNTIDRDMEMETRLTLVFTIALHTTHGIIHSRVDKNNTVLVSYSRNGVFFV